MLIRLVKHGLFAGARAVGLHSLVGRTPWRSRRLLILCYHGVSLDDEHRWNPRLYMSPELFRERMRALAEGGYRVLALDEALHRLQAGTLPPRAVALTFDDGTVDFARVAYPVLLQHGFPATVYLYTRYAGTGYPAAPPIASYLLWKGRGRTASPDGILDGARPSDPAIETATPATRAAQMARLDASLRAGTLEERDRKVALLADRLEVDYPAIKRSGILQIMGASELRSLDPAVVDVQLHTHNHITPPPTGPVDPELYARELEDNRRAITELIGAPARAGARRLDHFCYPSGVLRDGLPSAVAAAGVSWATTCATGLAGAQHDPLLLPRFVDTQNVPMPTFEAWLCGLAALLPRRV